MVEEKFPMMGPAVLLVAALFASEAVAGTAIAGEQTGSPAGVSRQNNLGQPAIQQTPPIAAARLDRVATAVDGAESSYGKDIRMWRPNPSGPQGPMQVSEAAATDVGGGDRFDSTQNRAIGRAYLAQLYWRYRNWPDAIAAYNWGVGNMDAWVKAGRPPDKFLIGVAVYLRRVLHDSGLCDGFEATLTRQPSERIGWRLKRDREIAGEPVVVPPDSLIQSGCLASDSWGGAISLSAAPTRFTKKLDQAMRLALQHAVRSP